MRSLELIVFDLAGTTVVDDGQVPAAFTAALSDRGVCVTPEQIKAVRGSSKREALQHLLPPGVDKARRVEEVYTSFRAILADQYRSAGVHAVPGAGEVFASLREHGVRVALNTGFDRVVTRTLLEALGWTDGIVDAVICGDDVPRGRPAPFMIFRAMESVGATSVHRVASIGDTSLDLQAGYNAGVRWNVGVLTGAHDRQTLEREPHTHLLSSIAELPRLVVAALQG